jgi:type II secretory pathway pseudopilin PulG
MIELLLVILLMGVIAAIGLPQLNGIYERQKSINVANEIMGQLEQARAKAIANEQIHSGGLTLSDCQIAPSAKPYNVGYGIVLHDDAPDNHHHIHLLYVPKTGTNSSGQPCPMPTQDPPINWVYPDGGIIVDERNENKLPGNTIFLSGLNSKVIFKRITGEIDYSIPGSIGRPPVGKSSTLLATVGKNAAVDLSYQVCVFPSGISRVVPKTVANSCP